jgi:hydroxymethylpyrimidine pyrophosphatase-like HAD family hydrolase
MIFKALACDFDGTLASEDRIGGPARSALRQAHEAGIRLILVTGRTFFELTRVCDCLDRFDAVVVENGGVLYFPEHAMIQDRGPAPSPRLLAELDRRGIYYQVGRVIVATARADERGVREALEAAHVTRDMVYNRAALMLLPPGISKGKAVERVLRSLGLSFQDVLAIGDAENDLALFEACGWAACPSNGVAALQERADWVLPGEDGDGVAAAMKGPIVQGLLSGRYSSRHRIDLGWVVESSEPLSIPVRDVNMLIHGDSLSGKSWMAGALIERLGAAHYAVCVIDPEGDYRVLARLPRVTWAEVMDDDSLDDALSEFDQDPEACVVADLSLLSHELKLQLIQTAFQKIGDSRRRNGLPHWLVLDEAHYSLHRQGVAADTIGIEHKGFCLVTYRPSWLRASVRGNLDLFVLARSTAAEELDCLRNCLRRASGSEAALATLPALPVGEFILIEPDSSASPVTFVPAARETAHVRHLKKYVDARVPFSERFMFRGVDGRVVAEARSLHDFRRMLRIVGEEVLAHHTRCGDFSRWVLDVFSDRELARQIRKTEARWCRQEIAAIREILDQIIASRYGVDA